MSNKNHMREGLDFKDVAFIAKDFHNKTITRLVSIPPWHSSAKQFLLWSRPTEVNNCRYPGRYPDLQAENVIGDPKGYREKIRYPGRYPDLQADNGRYPAHSLWRYIILYKGCGGYHKGRSPFRYSIVLLFSHKGCGRVSHGFAQKVS